MHIHIHMHLDVARFEWVLCANHITSSGSSMLICIGHVYFNFILNLHSPTSTPQTNTHSYAHR